MDVPELPEVETIVRELRPHLVGRSLTLARVSRKPLRQRWRPAWTAQLQGRRVEALRRRGKWIVAELDGGLALLIHLGMTGQLRVLPANTATAAHTHLVFDLDNGTQLRFRDVRRFGSARLFEDGAALEAFFDQSGLGPEPFTLDADYWRERLHRTRRALKAVLRDQTVVAGVGNIYADEALYEARLHPALLGCRVKPDQAERLRQAVIAVLNRAIDKRGSSIRDYVGGNGTQGGFQREFKVYGQFQKPCPRCQEPIHRVRLAGRSTHFCARCQKKKKEG
jgi:formamidopyrimidine-DNA glycosylase